jgi:UPF0755 protein
MKKLLAIVIILSLGAFWHQSHPTKNIVFPQEITIEKGTSLQKIAQTLKEKKIIQSVFLLKLCNKMTGNAPVQSGAYLFENPEHVCQIARKLSSGTYGDSRIKVTLPEGSTNREVANIIKNKIPNFDTQGFIEKTANLQGYLFPETYFFYKNVSPEEVIKELQDTYHREIGSLFQSVPPERQKQIIIMASILEREANNPDEAKVISGILWKRIEIGMPLQVDATLRYTTGRGSDKLTLDDLQRDGPYNTYTRKGIPPGAIGNPGTLMITAAMNPEKSAYVYYLHDTNGQIYYAKTHDEHVNNKNKYLR